MFALEYKCLIMTTSDIAINNYDGVYEYDDDGDDDDDYDHDDHNVHNKYFYSTIKNNQL